MKNIAKEAIMYFFVSFISGFIVTVMLGLTINTALRVKDIKIKLEQIEIKLEQEGYQEQQEEIETIEITLSGDYATYVEAKFPFDGEYYVETGKSSIFYSDIECTKEIKNPRFLSKESELIFYGNKKVYCYLLENGNICYSRGDLLPHLMPESYYNYEN